MLNSRERIKKIIKGETVDRPGFWLGDPHTDTWPKLLTHFDCPNEESLRLELGDDLRWIRGDRYDGSPNNVKFPSLVSDKLAVGEIPSDLQNYPWPDPKKVDYSQGLTRLAKAGDFYRAGGMWNTFYHDVAGIFGLENYFMLMHLEPDIVKEATRRVAEFYLATNETMFQKAGDTLDAYFFGNDFGTQLDLMFSPESFDEFLLPWLKEFTDQAHSHGLDVIFHSCGSIYRIIDRLIDIGIDCLHPLQARAFHMDADHLAQNFKGDITFMGGIDTQELLVHASPEEVSEEVKRVHRALGPKLIVSPSHEAILPNVNLDNVAAMAQTTLALRAQPVEEKES
ncbi:MAG: hypothetical protein H8E18_04730 [FCB group bacterium]|nr:hypothetical protein [FCB group bacterium]